MSRPLNTRSGGPYPSNAAGLGGLPTPTVDIPVCAVFIVFYLSLAATNSTIFRHNRRKQHKFLISVFLTGFCMARVGTLVLRIAWSTRQENIRLAIAAQIFVNAGVLVVYVINLVLAQRILRAKRPRIGWHPVLRLAYKILYSTVALALVMVIVAVVVSVYTLDKHTRMICRDLQLAALTYLLVFDCLPLIHIGAALWRPGSKDTETKDTETFGQGGMGSKMIILALSTCGCIVIAGFKAGANLSPVRPVTDPAWYDSKACFYVFNFTLEVLIICLLTFSRIDKRFFVPNGSNGPGDYSRT